MNENLGARLKKVRLQKGLTLEQVQKSTKIHLHILQALEGEGISDISPVYLKSFLKIYCKYLEVDPHEYIADYRETQYTVRLPQAGQKEPARAERQRPKTASRFEPPKVKKPAVASKAGDAARNFIASSRERLKGTQQISGTVLKKGGTFFKKAGSRVRSIRISQELKMGIVSVLVLIIVLGSLIKLGQVATRKVKGFIAHRRAQSAQRSSAARQEPAQKQERGVVEASVPASAATAAAVPAQPAAEALPAAAAKKEEAIRLVIRAHQNCWVYLKADGKVVFQRILEKGRFENWEAQEKMELSLGNAGGVEIEVNGQVFKNLGRSRQALKNIVITKDGMQIE